MVIEETRCCLDCGHGNDTDQVRSQTIGKSACTCEEGPPLKEPDDFIKETTHRSRHRPFPGIQNLVRSGVERHHLQSIMLYGAAQTFLRMLLEPSPQVLSKTNIPYMAREFPLSLGSTGPANNLLQQEASTLRTSRAAEHSTQPIVASYEEA